MLLAPTLSILSSGSGAIVRPTFSRDFAGEKTLNNGTGPAIAFTRGSAATYFDANGTLQTASNDEPRFDHSGGSSLGLLIEESRQNLFERSEEFDNVYWTKTSTTVTANTSVAPDGTTSAETLTETTANTGHFTSRSVSITSGTSYTLSVFAKAGTSSILMLTLGDTEFGGAPTRAWFDLSTGAAGSTNGSPAATSIQSVGNGWYRCTITKAATATASAPFYISIAQADGSTASYVGSTSNNFLIWGAQLEAGAFPTSYIPTTSAAVTRSADSAVVTPISGFYNQSEGTLFAEASAGGAANSNAALVSVDDASADERIQLRRNKTAGQANAVVSDGGVLQANILTGTWTSDTAVQKVIAGYKADDIAIAFNGAAPATDTAATLPTVTQMVIGFGQNSQHANGHIRKLAYYPKRLSNALLQSLTA